MSEELRERLLADADAVEAAIYNYAEAEHIDRDAPDRMREAAAALAEPVRDMSRRRREVLTALCNATAKFAAATGYRYATDCFCGEGGFHPMEDEERSYRFDTEALDRICNAIARAAPAAPAVPGEPQQQCKPGECPVCAAPPAAEPLPTNPPAVSGALVDEPLRVAAENYRRAVLAAERHLPTRASSVMRAEEALLRAALARKEG